MWCAHRSKALLPSFQRMGKAAGVVEFVLSGHKLKVRGSLRNFAASLTISVCRMQSRACQARPQLLHTALKSSTAEWQCYPLLLYCVVTKPSPMQVFLPKEGVTVAFCPSGVRTPQRPSPMGRDGRPIQVHLLYHSPPNHACYHAQAHCSLCVRPFHTVAAVERWVLKVGVKVAVSRGPKLKCGG